MAHIWDRHLLVLLGAIFSCSWGRLDQIHVGLLAFERFCGNRLFLVLIFFFPAQK